MQHSILANQLSRYRDCIPFIHFNQIQVNVADFDPNLWHTLGLGIMQNLYFGSGSVDYNISDKGLIIGKFSKPSIQNQNEYVVIENLQVDTKLVRYNEGVFLVIVKCLSNDKPYCHVLHVTEDGMWLAPNRNYELEDTILKQTTEHLPLSLPDCLVSLSTIHLAHHLEYDLEMFENLY